MNTDRLCPGCMNDTGGEQICSICGYDMASKNDNFCLPVRFLLSERYVIGKTISVNTEGITYMAWDNASDTAVHIREYYPKGIAVRNPDKTVSVISGGEFYFNEGLMDFIEINKKLISTELQSVVPVLTVFEENGTVYAATPIIPSITLGSFLERNGGSLRWEQVRPLFLPLIDTIKGLHEMGIIHGGISPETIMVGRDGKLRLTGICIPRLRMVSQDSPTELYSGYAAAEQYGKLDASLSVASDVYALCAVLFRVIIGTTPPSAEQRLSADTLSIPARFADELPRQVLVAIANGMQVKVQNRTENIDVFKNELVYGETQENLRRAANIREAEQKSKQEDKQPGKKKSSSVKYAAVSAGVTAALFLIVAIVLLIVFKDQIFGSKEPEYVNSENIVGTQEEDNNSTVSESVMLYSVPDFTKKYYSEIIDGEYESFKFSIKGKEYSDEYERGQICAQSVKSGEKVKFGTQIQVTISLGPKEFELISVVGEEEAAARLKLLEEGFLPQNIIHKYVHDAAEDVGIVVKQEPKASGKVTADDVIIIYINEDFSEQDGDETQENNDDMSGNDVNQ